MIDVEVVAADELSRRAVSVLSDAIRSAIAERRRCALALSRGENPPGIFDRLASEDLDWDRVDIFQVDERAAPDGHPDRNLIFIERAFAKLAAGVHAMPVTDPDLDEAARRYAAKLERTLGTPPSIDVVHVGLGPDGHTASLLPGDPVLDVTDRYVATTGVHGGRRRMTLTYPALEVARSVVFVVAGESKTDALVGVVRGDGSLPAARLRHRQVTILADEPAARGL